MNRKLKIKRAKRKQIPQKVKEYENVVKKFGKPFKLLPLEKVIKFVSHYKVISSTENKNGIKVLKLKKLKHKKLSTI